MATSPLSGRPAIARTADAPVGVGQAIDNIRERFARAEAVVNALAASTSAQDQALAAQITALRAQVRSILESLALLEPDAGGGEAVLTRTFSAAEAMSAGAPVWISGQGLVSLIDPADPVSCSGFAGITVGSAAVGGDVDVRMPGSIIEIDGAAFTAGAPIYAALDGVTQAPTGNPLPVGVALDSTFMAVAAGTTALAALGFSAGEDDMPASVGLVRAAVLLAELIDTSSSPGPADGDVLTWIASSGRYEPRLSSGEGGILPVVNGEVPPVLVYLDDGSLVYTRIL